MLFSLAVLSHLGARPLAYCYPRLSLQSSIRFEPRRGGNPTLTPPHNAAQTTAIYLFALSFDSPASPNTSAGLGLPSHQPASASTVLMCLGLYFTPPSMRTPLTRAAFAS